MNSFTFGAIGEQKKRPFGYITLNQKDVAVLARYSFFGWLELHCPHTVCQLKPWPFYLNLPNSVKWFLRTPEKLSRLGCSLTFPRTNP